MPTLTVRNLPEAVHSALRVRAAQAGRSMEEEVRVLITDAVANENVSDGAVRTDVEARVAKAQAIVREMFGGELPKDVVDDFLAQRRAAAERGE